MDPVIFNYRTLSGFSPKELAISLCEAATSIPEDSISSYLTQAVECDGVPPSVFGVWLSVIKSPALTVAAVMSKSRGIRQYAFSHIKKWLRGNKWCVVWDMLGGVEGTLNLLGGLSVDDVRLLVHAILNSTKAGEGHEEKREHFTLLFQGLLPQLFPDAPYKSKDDRQLSKVYLNLLCACSASFINEFVGRIGSLDTTLKIEVDGRVIQSFPKQFQDLVLSEFWNPKKTSLVERCLPMLSQHIPPLPSQHKPRLLSASMDFSIRFLEVVAGTSTWNFSPNILISQLVLPLLRRMVRRKLPLESFVPIYRFTIQIASNHRSVAADPQFYSSSQFTFCYYVLGSWDKGTDIFQGVLESMLDVIALNCPYKLESSDALLQNVSNNRYELLRLIGLRACNPPVDIENIDSLREVATKVWQPSIFSVLERGQDYKFLGNLMQASNDTVRIQPGYGALRSHPAVFGEQYADVFLFRNMLARDQEALEVATRKVEENKRISVRSRDQAERAFYAKSAILYSISSRDLALYRATVDWSWRFFKDPWTIKSLLASDITNTGEMINHLSGISRPSTMEKDQIRSRIQRGDEILMTFLDSALKALREPSFSARDWISVLQLFRNVSRTRFSGARALQDHFNLNDEEMYELVWDDTLSTLITAEEISLKPEYQALGFCTPEGFLGIPYVSPGFDVSFEKASARFLDGLANARNELWMRKRTLETPAVAVLAAPWPRGLPIQQLLPLSAGCLAPNSCMPYMMSRARSIVLLDREFACSTILDEDTRRTIGDFTEDYTYALKWFVSCQIETDGISSAWSHALKNFIGPNQPFKETRKIWQQLFFQVLGHQIPLPEYSDDKRDESIDYEVALPDDADDLLQNEWNPAANELEQRKDVAVERNLILKLAYDRGRLIQGSMALPSPIIIPGSTRHGIWNLNETSKSLRNSGKHLEGLLISALLYLNTLIGGPVRILSEAFPNETTSKRYPPLFLANEFVSQESHTGFSDSAAIGTLSDLLRRVPTSLLLTTTQGALEALGSTDMDPSKIVSVESIFYETVRLLVQSDKPESACNIVCQAVLSRPESSSWHRYILNRAFLKRLPREIAENFMRVFAKRIIEPSQPQKSQVAGEGRDKQARKNPLVKITTLKLFAQLLVNGDIFSLPIAISMLQDILINQSHIDVRVAALQSILELLDGVSTAELSDTTIAQVNTLLTALVPITGGLSERLVPGEDIWAAFRERNELPDIDHEKPLYDSLMQTVANAKLNPQENRTSAMKDLAEVISSQVLLPALRSSISAHWEWLENFNKKFELGLDLSSWPVPTPDPETLRKFVGAFFDWVSVDLFKLYNDYVLFVLQLPEPLKDANRRIMDNSDLRASAEGKHWLQIFGPNAHTHVSTSFAFGEAIRSRDWNAPPSEGGICVDDVQDAAVIRARALLESEIEDPLHSWRNFVFEFSVRWWELGSKLGDQGWKMMSETILRRIITDIDALRTPEWNKAMRRCPARLPSTFEPRLWLSKLKPPMIGMLSNILRALQVRYWQSLMRL